MARVRFATHQGKRILLVDLTNCSTKDVAEVQRVVTVQPRKSTLTLDDLTDAQFSRDVITRMKEVAVFAGHT